MHHNFFFTNVARFCFFLLSQLLQPLDVAQENVAKDLTIQTNFWLISYRMNVVTHKLALLMIFSHTLCLHGLQYPGYDWIFETSTYQYPGFEKPSFAIWKNLTENGILWHVYALCLLLIATGVGNEKTHVICHICHTVDLRSPESFLLSRPSCTTIHDYIFSCMCSDRQTVFRDKDIGYVVTFFFCC